jgi:hypothetical protein
MKENYNIYIISESALFTSLLSDFFIRRKSLWKVELEVSSIQFDKIFFLPNQKKLKKDFMIISYPYLLKQSENKPEDFIVNLKKYNPNIELYFIGNEEEERIKLLTELGLNAFVTLNKNALIKVGRLVFSVIKPKSSGLFRSRTDLRNRVQTIFLLVLVFVQSVLLLYFLFK